MRGSRAQRVDRTGLTVAALALLATLAVLFVPHAVGLADNGDRIRLFCQFHLLPTDPSAHRLGPVALQYRTSPAAPPCERHGYLSTALLPLAAARLLSPALTGSALDLRVLAVLYALALAAALGWLTAALPGSPRRRLLVGLVATALLTDLGFVAYFASGFSEPLGLVSAVAVLAAAQSLRRARASGRHQFAALLAYAVAVAAFVGDKTQYAPLALLLLPLLLGLRVGRRRPDEARPAAAAGPPRVLGAVLALGLAAVTALAVAGQPQDYAHANAYDAVFYSLLPHSHDPAAALSAIGEDPELARWSRSNFYFHPNALDDPHGQRFFADFSYLRLSDYFLHHPAEGWALVRRGATATLTLRDPELPTEPIGATRVPGDAGRWGPVTVAGRAVGGAGWVALAALLAVAGGLAWRRRDGLLGLAAGLTATSLLLAVLGEGDYELVKHSYSTGVWAVLTLALLGAAGPRRGHAPQEPEVARKPG